MFSYSIITLTASLTSWTIFVESLVGLFVRYWNIRRRAPAKRYRHEWCVCALANGVLHGVCATDGQRVSTMTFAINRRQCRSIRKVRRGCREVAPNFFSMGSTQPRRRQRRVGGRRRQRGGSCRASVSRWTRNNHGDRRRRPVSVATTTRSSPNRPAFSLPSSLTTNVIYSVT